MPRLGVLGWACNFAVFVACCVEDCIVCLYVHHGCLFSHISPHLTCNMCWNSIEPREEESSEGYVQVTTALINMEGLHGRGRRQGGMVLLPERLWFAIELPRKSWVILRSETW